ncbi:hypothetical protein D3C83_184500 [compost metagenome]
MITDIESARNLIKPSKESRIVQNLVNSFLQHPRGGELIQLGVVASLKSDV